MTTKRRDKFNEEIRSNLFSSDESVALKAIHRCRDEGNATLVEPLIAFYASDADVSLKKEVAALLSTLKVSKVEDYFLDGLKDPAMKHIRKDLIMFMWNSDIRPVDRLVDITAVALDGNFEETFECLTLIENFEDPVPEEVLIENIAMIRQHDVSNFSIEHKGLIHSYLNVLESMRVQDDLDAL